MKKNKNKLFILVLTLPLLFFSGLETSAKAEEDLEEVNEYKPTFFDVRSISPTINEEEYFDFLRISVLTQPEYLYANSNDIEKSESLKFAKRQRLPELSVKVINDKVIDRKITDRNSLRKRQDDSFDAAIEFSQPIYSGGAINAQINKSSAERSISQIEKINTLSKLLITADEIYLTAVKSDLLFNYGNEIINEIIPYKEKVKERVTLGIADPVELALFSIKFNELQSKVQVLKTTRLRDIAIYEYFFQSKFDNPRFPEVLVPRLTINKGKKGYEVQTSKLNYETMLQDTNIVRSDYLPKFGINTRYTRYDLDENTDESDIRGGIYFSMPIFTFGRGSARISASKAKANASKMNIEIEKKNDEASETEIVNLVESTHTTRGEIYESFIDTQNQRRIIRNRLDSTNFSALSFADSAIEELLLFERFLNNEITMLHGYFMYLHQNRQLTNHIRIAP